MALPCTTDGCGITTTADGDGKLTIATNLAPSGGLDCDGSNRLRVDLDASDACNNLLTLGAAGLSALRPEVQVWEKAASRVAFYADGGTTLASSSFFIENLSETCPMFVVLFANYQYQFTTDDADAWATSGALRLSVGGTNRDIPFEMSGSGEFGAGDIHRDSRSYQYAFVLDPATDVNVQTFGTGRSSDGQIVAGHGGSNGLTAAVRGIAFHLAPTASTTGPLVNIT